MTVSDFSIIWRELFMGLFTDISARHFMFPNVSLSLPLWLQS